MARGTARPLLVEVDESSSITRCEGSVFRELGLAPGRLIGRDFTELVSDYDTLLLSESLFALACDGGSVNIEFEMTSTDGGAIPVEGQLRAFRYGNTHIYTRFSGVAMRSGARRKPVFQGYEKEINDVVGRIEEELAGPVRDILTFSHFSLADENGKTLGEAIEKSADTMERVISIHGRGKGSAFRTAVNAVSTLHGSDFKPSVVADRVDRAVGALVSPSVVSVDLLGSDMSDGEKLETVEEFLGVASIKPSTPEPDQDDILSVDAFKVLSDSMARLAFDNDIWTEETFLRATDLACWFVRFSFLDDIPWPREPTKGQRSFARELLRSRLDRITTRATESPTPIPIFVVDAKMLELIDIESNLAALKAMIVETTDFPRADDAGLSMVYERFRRIPRLLVNGIELTNNATLQNASRRASGLELVALPFSVLSAAPRETITTFQQTISARNDRKIGVLIKDLSSEANPDLFRSLPDIYLSGDFLTEAGR